MSERLKTVSIKSPQDYIAEIIGPELHDGCNLSEDENDEHACESNNLKASNSGMYRKERIYIVIYSSIYTYLNLQVNFILQAQWRFCTKKKITPTCRLLIEISWDGSGSVVS